METSSFGIWDGLGSIGAGMMTLTNGGNVSHCIDYGQYNWHPTAWYYMPSQVEPLTCIGKAHVFECDHVKKCKCGSVERVMSTKKGRKS